jgi:flagellar motility protein MotE (MotC chaperone)
MRITLILLVFCLSLQAVVMKQGEFYKEKQELILLKQELSDFYEQQEKKYQQEKKEIENMLSLIKAEKEEIKKLKKQNQKIKDEITRTVVSRTITMYDKMKIKVALDIFKTMIANGKINEVFDIIIRLKQKRVLTLLKKFDTETKTILMNKMRNYKYKEKQNG